MLAVTAISIIAMRSILSVIMLSGIYSLLSATFFVSLDAVDVAFTEAAVGAGVSSVFLIATVYNTKRRSSD